MLSNQRLNQKSPCMTLLAGLSESHNRSAGRRLGDTVDKWCRLEKSTGAHQAQRLGVVSPPLEQHRCDLWPVRMVGSARGTHDHETAEGLHGAGQQGCSLM